MKYLLIAFIGLTLGDRPINLKAYGIGESQLEFLIEHDAYDDIIETFFKDNNDEHYRVKKESRQERRVQ